MEYLSALRLWKKLEHRSQETQSPVEESAHLSLETLAGYFQSHPPSEERADQVRRLIRTEHWPAPQPRPLKHA